MVCIRACHDMQVVANSSLDIDHGTHLDGGGGGVAMVRARTSRGLTKDASSTETSRVVRGAGAPPPPPRPPAWSARVYCLFIGSGQRLRFEETVTNLFAWGLGPSTSAS